MPGVEEDAEERVAEMAQAMMSWSSPPADADADRPVPLGDRGEVRRHEALDVVADAVRAARGILDHEAGAAGQGAPDAEGGGERVAALDRTVATG